jgi:hypothetical protein
MTDEFPVHSVDDDEAGRRSAILAENDRMLERVASIRMASGPGPWPVADAAGNVIRVTDSD